LGGVVCQFAEPIHIFRSLGKPVKGIAPLAIDAEMAQEFLGTFLAARRFGSQKSRFLAENAFHNAS